MPQAAPRLAVALSGALALTAALAALPPAASRRAAGQPEPVPELGDAASRAIVVVGNRADGLDVPRDLAFHPNRPYELWTVNRTTDGTVIFFDPGTPAERVEDRKDSHRNHFMEEASSIAFGDFGNFATCQESRNTYDGRSQPNDFMGPTLWTADLDIYARVNQRRAAGAAMGHVPLDERRGAAPDRAREDSPARQGAANPFGLPDALTAFCRPLDGAARSGSSASGAPNPDQERNPELGSHIDMLHQSPLCMGIEHEQGNAYWVADGTAGHLVRYDFAVDHGPGWDDHSDGIVRRFPEAAVERVADVPSHLALDRATGWLYAADTGRGRVIRLDIASGRRAARLTARNEPLAELSRWEDAAVEVFATGLRRPSGLAVVRDGDGAGEGGRLFVGEHGGRGTIVAYDLATGTELGRLQTGARGLAGLEVGPDGRLYFVDMDADTVSRIDPDGRVPYEPPPVTPRPTLAPSPTAGPTSEAPTATATATEEATAAASATTAATEAPTGEPTATSAPTATEEPAATEPPAAPRLFAPWAGAGRR